MGQNQTFWQITDQGGYLPFPLRRLTPHSLSRRVRDLLAGDLGDHREYPADPDDEHPPDQSAPDPPERGVYSAEDWRRAWARRRADLDTMAGIDQVLSGLDQRVADLGRRTAAVLAAESQGAR